MKPETVEAVALVIDPQAFEAGHPHWNQMAGRRRAAIKTAEKAIAAYENALKEDEIWQQADAAIEAAEASIDAARAVRGSDASS